MPHRTCGGWGRKPAVTESVTEKKPPGATSARVKRRGKSSPPGAQAPGHEKPHAVQDRTGSWAACRILPGNRRTGRKAGPLRFFGTKREINGHPARGNMGATKFGLQPSALTGARRETGERPFFLLLIANFQLLIECKKALPRRGASFANSLAR